MVTNYLNKKKDVFVD